jgi:hypothetical protein
MSNKQEIINLWKELKVDYVNFEFSCGGDSMNDTSIQIYDESGKEIENSELSNYFDDEVYKQVTFYEASDGHYQGESGNVGIYLSDDEEDFDYSKSSQSEWTERHSSIALVNLSDEEIKFIKEKILNINGSGDAVVLNYKQDCILTDDEEVIANDLEKNISDILDDYEPADDVEGELGSWYIFTTNEEGEEIKFSENGIYVQMQNEITIFKDED